jgi:3-hydroxyacyl-CoA dehydrogenase
MSDRVAVVGAGTIGLAWALVFARAGHAVAVHDTEPARLRAMPAELRRRLDDLAAARLLDEPVDTVLARVRADADLASAVREAVHVQECAPEDLALKRELFGTLDRLAPAGATLASSSSALTASAIAGALDGRARCLVAHPANPPYLLPVVELVPAPFTAPDTVDRCAALMGGAGLAAVRVRRELDGFVFNRLQGAVLREAYCLVRDGVASVEDVDQVVRLGLGPRWAVIGPFETADLNTRGGIAAHAERLGAAYARMGADRGQDDPWTPELVAHVTAERRALLPIERWEERVAWRDRALIAAERGRREHGPAWR